MQGALLILLIVFFSSTAMATPRLLEQGINEYRTERYEEAQETLSAAQKEEPASSAVAYYLGLAMKQTGELEKAVANLKLSLQNEPVKPEAYPELVESLYLQGNVAEAVQWISKAEAAGVTSGSFLFMKGQVMAKAEDRKSALEAFTAAKTLDPALAQQADFQMAQVYIAQGDREKAQESLRSVISGDPSSDLAGYAREYERRLSTSAPRNWHLYLGTNVQFDDNVIVKPSAGLGVPTVHDWSSNQSLRVTYDLPASDAWLFNAQYTFYNNSYFKRDEYSQLAQGLTLAPAYRFTPQLMLSTPVTLNYTLLGYGAYSNQFGVKPTLTAFFSENQIGQASFSFSRRNFITTVDPVENRDANGYAGQLGYMYLFAGNAGFFNLRYEPSFEDAKGNNWAYLGNRLNGDLLIPITAKTSAVVSLEGFWQDYLNSHTANGVKRKDTTFTATVNLSRELMEGLFLNIQYYHTSAFSNFVVYEYKRNVYSAGIEVRF